MTPTIRRDDLHHPAVRALITEHLRSMYAHSPPESVHALGIEKLRSPDLSFWTAWDGESTRKIPTVASCLCGWVACSSAFTGVGTRRPSSSTNPLAQSSALC
ncbi:MAG: hypothetical protein RLZZ227_146 [Pseudomonadota bacterium]|jgi:hypothetical protein